MNIKICECIKLVHRNIYCNVKMCACTKQLIHETTVILYENLYKFVGCTTLM